MVLQVSLWKCKGPFDTFFNKFVSQITGGPFCHAEVCFLFTKEKWKELLESYDDGMGLVKQRASNLWKRMEKLLEKVPDEVKVPLVFYSIWGNQNNVRLLTSNDNYIFNRFYDEEYTKILNIKVKNDADYRVALGYCLHELHKPYDSIGAFTFWVPKLYQRQEGTFPSKYFCSEHVMYMLQQIGLYKNVIPESVTPNDINKILQGQNSNYFTATQSE
tara:strand:- start:130 stop:780 length:651 start_codon:yes stop_codon:yes gene_type:complete